MPPDAKKWRLQSHSGPAYRIAGPEKTNYFIDHQPKELDETAAAGVDLDLCGHTHDGRFSPET